MDESIFSFVDKYVHNGRIFYSMVTLNMDIGDYKEGQEFQLAVFNPLFRELILYHYAVDGVHQNVTFKMSWIKCES